MARGRIEYKTEKLSSYTARVYRNTEELARKLVILGENRLQRHIRLRTPTDTGRLKASIRTEHAGRWESVRLVNSPFVPVMPAGLRLPSSIAAITSVATPMRVLEGSVYSDVYYAPFVEYDTGKYGPNPGSAGGGRYFINPRLKKALAFWYKGEYIIVAYVRHPGSRGKHMFRNGAAYVAKPFYLHNQSKALRSAWRARGSIVRPRRI